MTDDLPPPAPPRSALTLRLWLASFGIVFCGVAAVLALRADLVVLAVVMAVLVVVLIVDLGRVIQRKMRGEPG
ncbi:DUF6343 family protein [Saccharothrix coeruleofusca]|uniref:Uncharacterized protein n=1 Tax=Saccharothrix coeruleofusca TaxID=33919 RepID=A0A918ARV0_9PSEU|nr:DUF6343 family protein [Saccharothrix coeruleofusca]MBP2335880.1 hypothetical protein [Saccharothrix coeruleofusca]GGP76884.1 hypothetical protein GCM10010185_58360 [Saccharothrix coeruleofusca]